MKDSQKQIIKYILIGISAVFVDLVVYYTSKFYFESEDFSKALGFIVGSIYTFMFNKIWTWKQKDKAGIKQLSIFFIVYAVSLFINVIVNRTFISLLPDYEFDFILYNPLRVPQIEFSAKLDILLAFGIATICSAFWNFFGQKYFVFKGKK